MEELTMQQQLSLPATYEQKMTPEIARKVEELKSSIDIHDKGKVIAYGREEQAHLSKFSESILQGVGTKEVGEAGKLLTKVIGDINGYKVACENDDNVRFFAFFRKQKSKIQTLQTKYKSVADNIDIVVKELQNKDLALGQVSRNFEMMYVENKNMYEFLTMVIYAGEQALKDEKIKLQNMQKEAEMSEDLMEIQNASDFNDDIIRFERRLYDLKLTRTIAIQQAGQIKNIQKGADELSESIKTTIVTSIPLWKNQMAAALGMQVIQGSLNAVNAVKDATNEMMKKNAELNKQLTLETAQAVERGVLDIETVNVVNQKLIESLSGSYEIAKQAIASREEGAKQLQKDEAELKAAIVKYTNLN
ncbi:MAG: toxic anion resistance protein [Clostridia bacterium]|nr:toxic anion resistance protein [Clostridia bacterium]